MMSWSGAASGAWGQTEKQPGNGNVSPFQHLSGEQQGYEGYHLNK